MEGTAARKLEPSWKLPPLFNTYIPESNHLLSLTVLHRGCGWWWAEVHLTLPLLLRPRPWSAVYVSCSLLAQEEAAQHPGGPAARTHRVQDR